jgi:hypothetical protein
LTQISAPTLCFNGRNYAGVAEAQFQDEITDRAERNSSCALSLIVLAGEREVSIHFQMKCVYAVLLPPQRVCVCLHLYGRAE